MPRDECETTTKSHPQTHHLADLRMLRLILHGESVIDDAYPWLLEKEDIDSFLQILGFDLSRPKDVDRLYQIHQEAVMYLSHTHRYTIPAELISPKQIQDLFLLAAGSERKKVQKMACMLLKVAHIILHIAGKELLFNTPISESQLFARLSPRVFGAFEQLRAQGVAVVAFSAGQKSRTSMITKLLAKRTNLATHIYDRLRFRLVLRTKEDVIKALLFLLRDCVAFNYILPEQSQNTLLSSQDIAHALNLDAAWVQRCWPPAPLGKLPASAPRNEFTHKAFRCLNFVADLPLRIDDLAPQASPAIAFVQTEIQLLDSESESENERGESSHSFYKQRQRNRVRERLEHPAQTLQGLFEKEPSAKG